MDFAIIYTHVSICIIFYFMKINVVECEYEAKR